MHMSVYNQNICIIVEEFLGDNLETIMRQYGTLSLPVVCSIGIQMVILH